MSGFDGTIDLDMFPSSRTPAAPKGTIAFRDAARIITAWSSPDDWGVMAIYSGTANRLLRALSDGIAASDIVAHANHLGGKHAPVCATIDKYLDSGKRMGNG